MMEAANISETSVNSYQSTRRNNPEDNHSVIALSGPGVQERTTEDFMNLRRYIANMDPVCG
jgi:hypothetical protein